VLVVGDGKLGLLVAQTLALTGCHLQVIGRHQHKLQLLRERGIDAGTTDTIDAQHVDIAVECTGNTQGFALALRALRPRGTLVMKSTYAGALQVDAAAIVVNEIHLIGSRCGPFAPALQLLAEERVAVTPLIDAAFSLVDALDAFDRARRPGSLKVLLHIS
jgi:threonine dehydrogenase-like Zn-dependent dehydrogenase